MNGQFPHLLPAAGHAGKLPARRRLVAALAISCLAHLALLAAAYLGGTAAKIPLPPGESRKLPPPFTAALTAAQPTQPEALRETASSGQRTEGIGLLPISAPAYYPTDQLTKRPQPLGSADLDAPEVRMIVASGKMILKLWIDEFGAVVKVDIENTDLPEALSGPTVAAFQRLRFTPGERGGLPVGSVMKIEVSYDDARVAVP